VHKQNRLQAGRGMTTAGRPEEGELSAQCPRKSVRMHARRGWEWQGARGVGGVGEEDDGIMTMVNRSTSNR